MTFGLGYRETLALTLEQLVQLPKGQHGILVTRVLQSAETRGLIPRGPALEGSGLSDRERQKVEGWVQEALWDCLLKRLLMFGMDGSNSNWPFYRLTDHGLAALKGGTPQPYDPDGFLGYFRTTCPNVDAEVASYVSEAVTAFNAGCMRSAAVMLGCASEKLILLLSDTFEAAISDPARKSKFTKELGANWTISHRYKVLHARLEDMVTSKKLPPEHRETVEAEMPSGYGLLRRCRNAAGHPQVPGTADAETVFMNLRMFTEYARRMVGLVEHFSAQAADW